MGQRSYYVIEITSQSKTKNVRLHRAILGQISFHYRYLTTRYPQHNYKITIR